MQLIIPEKKDYKIGNYINYVPVAAQHDFGCSNCEWKESGKCQFGFKAGTGNKKEDNCHTNGICQERKEYLSIFSSGKFNSYAQWIEAWNAKMAQSEILKNIDEIKTLREQIRNANEPREISRLQKEFNKRRQQWLNILRMQRDYMNRQLDRETPQKVEIEHKFNLSDFHRIIRKSEVIDADYKEKPG